MVRLGFAAQDVDLVSVLCGKELGAEEEVLSSFWCEQDVWFREAFQGWRVQAGERVTHVQSEGVNDAGCKDEAS